MAALRRATATSSDFYWKHVGDDKLKVVSRFDTGKLLYDSSKDEAARSLAGRAEKAFAGTFLRNTGPFDDMWGAIRNFTGFVLFCVKLAAATGLITLAPHAALTLLLIYGCFIGIQAINTFIMGYESAVSAQVAYQKAKAIGDVEGMRTANLQCLGALFTFVEGTFWMIIAVVDICGLVTLSGQLMNFLFTWVFNITFAYAACCGIRNLIRHRAFATKLKSQTLEQIRQDLKEGTPQEIAVKLARFAEQTSEEFLKAVLDSTGENDTLKEALRLANLKKCYFDLFVIGTKLFGNLCFADCLIPNANASEITDWWLWVVLNLMFYFFLSNEHTSDAVHTYFAQRELANEEELKNAPAPLPA